MSALTKLFFVLGGVNAALAVALGAFGAHVLKARIPGDMMAVYQTAFHYHAMHALGLLAVGAAASWLPGSGYLKLAGWAMVAGIVLFSGSLYILSASGARWLGSITPFGGVAFICGWIAFCAAVLKGSG